MHRSKLLLSLLLPAALLAGCSDYLNGPKLSDNPNIPTSATRSQLLNAVQVVQAAQYTDAEARLFTMWTQQFAGTDRQYVTLSNYVLSDDALSFSSVYAGGGLVDIRKIQKSAEAEGDLFYRGVAKVWEALAIGWAADIFGDVPYSEAVGETTTPKFDKQMDVYAALQTLLSSAITDLACSAPACRGPGTVDLIYGGDRTKWTQVANTLKARYHMHTAEKLGAPAYAAALAAANAGISTSANDFRSYQGAATADNNPWYQFVEVQRSGYLSAGKYLVDRLIARSDPRLSQYFAPAGDGQYRGAPPGISFSTASSLSAARLAPAFRQPIVTWAENQGIIAEAAYRGGDEVRATTAMNAIRTAAGMSPIVGLTGEPLLAQIMEEKYIALFQNMETYNDYRRTCYPKIKPAANKVELPPRVVFPFGERNVNPKTPADPLRNDNDPNPCPAVP